MPLLSTVVQAFRRFVPNSRIETSIQDSPIPFGTALPVSRLIQAIRSSIPTITTDEYGTLSTGQQALVDASIYLEYHKLDQAALICAEALGDERAPGDEWVNTLIEAIRLAQKMPGTDEAAWKERDQIAWARWEAKIGLMESIVSRLNRSK